MPSTRTLLKLALLAPFALLSLRGTSEEIAPINVSLAIQQSCTVQSGDDATASRPSVSCLHGEPFDISRTSSDTTSSPSKVRVAAAGADTTVWTVTF